MVGQEVLALGLMCAQVFAITSVLRGRGCGRVKPCDLSLSVSSASSSDSFSSDSVSAESDNAYDTYGTTKCYNVLCNFVKFLQFVSKCHAKEAKRHRKGQKGSQKIHESKNHNSRHCSMCISIDNIPVMLYNIQTCLPGYIIPKYVKTLRQKEYFKCYRYICGVIGDYNAAGITQMDQVIGMSHDNAKKFVPGRILLFNNGGKVFGESEMWEIRTKYCKKSNAREVYVPKEWLVPQLHLVKTRPDDDIKILESLMCGDDRWTRFLEDLKERCKNLERVPCNKLGRTDVRIYMRIKAVIQLCYQTRYAILLSEEKSIRSDVFIKVFNRILRGDLDTLIDTVYFCGTAHLFK